MANKKRKKQRSRQRQSFAPAAPSTPVGASTEASSGPAAASATSATAPSVARPAYATGITGPRKATQGGAAATGVIDIDARVPYFSSDLRRVLVTALVMIVLIVAGSLLIK